MVKYKLTVVSNPNGTFLVNYYHKIPDKKVENLEEVVKFMSQLNRTVLEAEPSYVSVDMNDRVIIEGARKRLLSSREVQYQK